MSIEEPISLMPIIHALDFGHCDFCASLDNLGFPSRMRKLLRGPISHRFVEGLLKSFSINTTRCPGIAVSVAILCQAVISRLSNP